jgi:hypothetical protein
MLSWSGRESDLRIDLLPILAGGGDAGVEFSDELLHFASAAAWMCPDTGEMAAARQRLVDAAGEATMIDAAAVAANFHMMTRLADGTGARLPQARLDSSADAIAIMGTDQMSSHRLP